jgi:hypothetical protein
MNDISTFRRHMGLGHGQFCSWSGHVRDFVDGDEKRRVCGVLSRSGKHKPSVGPVPAASVGSDEASQNTPTEPRHIRRLRREVADDGDDAELSATLEIPLDPSTFDQLYQDLTGGSAIATAETASRQRRESGSQTYRHHGSYRDFGVQTPVGENPQLPPGWDVRRLVQLAEQNPLTSPRGLAFEVSRQSDSARPLAQFDNVNLVIQTYDETVRLLISKVDEIQQPLQRPGITPEAVVGVRRAFDAWVAELQGRARTFGGSVVTSQAGADTEEPVVHTHEPTARRGRRRPGTPSSTTRGFSSSRPKYAADPAAGSPASPGYVDISSSEDSGPEFPEFDDPYL